MIDRLADVYDRCRQDEKGRRREDDPAQNDGEGESYMVPSYRSTAIYGRRPETGGERERERRTVDPCID